MTAPFELISHRSKPSCCAIGKANVCLRPVTRITSIPLFCARRLNGLIDRALFDSVNFVGPDHEIRFAVNDVRALNRFNHDRRMRKLNGALIGAGLGFFGTMALGVINGSGTNNQGFKSGGGPSVGSALIVGGMGALAGALTGSRYSGDFPPYLADAQH